MVHMIPTLGIHLSTFLFFLAGTSSLLQLQLQFPSVTAATPSSTQTQARSTPFDTSTRTPVFINSRSFLRHSIATSSPRAHPAFQHKNKSKSRTGTNTSIQMKSSSPSVSESDSSKMMDHLSSNYNSFASAAVDISQARVSTDHVLTFVRSARDIDDNARRQFLHHIVLPTFHSHSPEEEEKEKETSANVNVPWNPIVLPPTQISSNVQARVPSPSGNSIAIFTKGASTSNGNEKQQSVEIWTEGGTTLARKIALPSSIHGDICFDTAWFGSIQWNQDETAIVYSAEMNAPTTKSFFDLNASASTSTGGSEDVVFGGTNTLGFGQKETWGEKYTNTARLMLYVLHVDTGNVAMVPNVPGHKDDNGNGNDSDVGTLGGYSLGQAVFSPDGNSIVYTAWDAGAGGNMPKRLGSIYCYQRHCAIYHSPVANFMNALSITPDKADSEETLGVGGEKDDGFKCLTPNDRLARSPRFVMNVDSGDGASSSSTKLMWLSNAKGFDTHGGCMGLSSLDWGSGNDVDVIMETRKEIVDVVHDPENDESFPGLFVNQLPSGNFVSKDGKFLLLASQWRSITKVIKIDIATGDVYPVNFNLNGNDDNFLGSQNILCLTRNGDAIVSQSEPNSPPSLGFISSASLLREGTEALLTKQIAHFGPVAATSKYPAKSVIENSDRISYHVIRTHPEHGDVRAPVEGILLLPPTSEKVPLVVVPHGGPHSCTPTVYVPSYAYLCQTGKFGILHVNYRGSSGFGQAALESLAGTVGDQDVKDVVHLTNHVLKEYEGKIDASKVGVCGGSHGGFLAGHLIGQYPDLFKVAAMRNPVTNIATMTTATDIPDWTYVECFGPDTYDWSKFRGPNKDDLAAMWDASPIAHIQNVKAPTLLAIGNSDKRVPPSQGIEYYHALRSQGVNTKLLLYDDDDHAIDKVQSEADHWINILKWFVAAFA